MLAREEEEDTQMGVSLAVSFLRAEILQAELQLNLLWVPQNKTIYKLTASNKAFLQNMLKPGEVIVGEHRLVSMDLV